MTDDRIFLLSIEEAKTIPRTYLETNCWWWLRTSGFDNELVGTVNFYGNVFSSSKYAYDTNGGVRPAVRFDSEDDILSLKTTNGGFYIFLGKTWINVTDFVGFPCLLKKKPFKKVRRFDPENNNYANSEIRKWIIDWYEKESIKRIRIDFKVEMMAIRSCSNCKWFGTKNCFVPVCFMPGRVGHYLWKPVKKGE